MLVSLIKVLHQYGGIKTLAEANALLLAGHFSPLTPGEQKRANLVDNQESSSLRFDELWLMITIYLQEMFTHAKENVRMISSRKNTEPAEHWSHWLLAILGRTFNNLSSENVFLAVAWTGIWLLVWRFSFPLMQWPYVDARRAWTVMLAYVASSLVLPVLIGWLTPTKTGDFWQRQGLGTSRLLRLYTVQGAIVGFHLGYVMVFAIALLLHYFGFSRLPNWIIGLAAAWPVLLGYAAAKQVPFNLWRAYGRLDLKDGAIFFVFVLFGPLFGVFFFDYYPLLLAPDTGITIVLLAAGILAGFMTWQRRRTVS